VGHIFFLVLLSCVAVVSIALPWVGVVCAYLIVVLVPQAIWFWDFLGIRPALWVLLPTAVGIGLGLLRGQFDLSILRSKRNLCFLVLWLCLAISYFFGAYTQVSSPFRFENPEEILGNINKMMLLYFMACLCIDTEQKLKALLYAVCGSAAYMIYWANSQYLSHHVMGRLAGPVSVTGGVYQDENAFAMLFVVAQPFLWYLGSSFKRPVYRWGCWLLIPFGWHAVFLTASRGGLVGLGVTTLLIAIRSKRRLLGLALIPALAVAFIWQGGNLMKGRAETISQYQTENSAATRLQAWRAASRMIADHPFIGVGLASFGPAFPHYSEDQPREAHNTFFQITAESGVLAGAMYALIVIMCIVSLWGSANRLRGQDASLAGSSWLYSINEAALIAFCGLVTCSLFLSLQVFEIFYCLNVFANAVLYLGREPPGSIAGRVAINDHKSTGSGHRTQALSKSTPK
jgi:putative inorganic carbon (hco3(-)) transporter